MQQPMPHNATGVPVTLSVFDSNGNYRTIGTTTTNALGDYGLTWTPDIPGNYTVYATFAGTNGYYASSASTFFHAGSPAPTPAPTATPLSGIATQSTLEYIGIAIIIVIIISESQYSHFSSQENIHKPKKQKHFPLLFFLILSKNNIVTR